MFDLRSPCDVCPFKRALNKPIRRRRVLDPECRCNHPDLDAPQHCMGQEVMLWRKGYMSAVMVRAIIRGEGDFGFLTGTWWRCEDVVKSWDQAFSCLKSEVGSIQDSYAGFGDTLPNHTVSLRTARVVTGRLILQPSEGA